MRNRHAASLAELLVVMSACSVILTLSAVLMHRVMRVQSTSREYLSLQRNCLRLSEQFRQDVRDAATAISDADGLPADAFLRLKTADQTIEYQNADGVIVREIREGDERVAREEYAFHPQIKLSVEQPEATGLVHLTITSNHSLSSPDSAKSTSISKRVAVALPVKLHLEARLGSNRRFAKPPAAEALP